MIPTFVFIFGALGLTYFIKKMIENHFEKKVKKVVLPKYIRKEVTEFDTFKNTYNQKNIYEVPGCGTFNSKPEAFLGAKGCALKNVRDKQ